MSAPNTTPGPWAASGHIIRSDDAAGRPVATATYFTGTTSKERAANAQLIAASPELYEALFALRFAYLPGEWDAAVAGADAALAKARGEA